MSNKAEEQREPLARQLSYSTVRVECRDADGNPCSIGTGFLFAFDSGVEGQNIPAIITNRHVIEGAMTASFRFTRADANGRPADRQHVTVTVMSVDSSFIGHPDPDVDLCAVAVGPGLNSLASQGTRAYFVPLDPSLVPNEEDLSRMHALDDVIMVGYPIGLWDSVNNKPLFRHGIAATHPNLDFEGRKEFIIDAACFPGSSGSPVFYYAAALKLGPAVEGGFRLLGVLWASPVFRASGKVETVPIPTRAKATAITEIPSNLGYVIKAERLMEFQPILRRMIEKAASKGGSNATSLPEAVPQDG